MASGCILGSCIYCGWLIWEDDKWGGDIENNRIYHINCYKEYKNNPLAKYSTEELLRELLRRCVEKDG